MTRPICPTCRRPLPGRPKKRNATEDAARARGRRHARAGLDPELGAPPAYLRSYRATRERMGGGDA